MDRYKWLFITLLLIIGILVFLIPVVIILTEKEAELPSDDYVEDPTPAPQINITEQEQYTQWGPWSGCDQNRITERRRTCSAGFTCPLQVFRQTDVCNCNEQEVWSAWSSCSAGMRSRTSSKCGVEKGFSEESCGNYNPYNGNGNNDPYGIPPGVFNTGGNPCRNEDGTPKTGLARHQVLTTGEQFTIECQKGWIVLLKKKQNGKLSFRKKYDGYRRTFHSEDYEEGFLGLDNFYDLIETSAKTKLWIKGRTTNGEYREGIYKDFRIKSGSSGYNLELAEDYFGNMSRPFGCNFKIELSINTLRDVLRQHAKVEIPDIVVNIFNLVGNFLPNNIKPKISVEIDTEAKGETFQMIPKVNDACPRKNQGGWWYKRSVDIVYNALNLKEAKGTWALPRLNPDFCGAASLTAPTPYVLECHSSFESLAFSPRKTEFKEVTMLFANYDG